jgi:hypothetical protein
VKIKEYKFQKKVKKQLKQLVQLLEVLTQEVYDMSVELDNLVLQVGETEGVEASVITLLDGIKLQLDAIIAELAAAQVDNAKLVELRDSLDASEIALSEAVAAFNAPPVPPVP